jgi:tetratricopeptide (TPR) repeat protein
MTVRSTLPTRRLPGATLFAGITGLVLLAAPPLAAAEPAAHAASSTDVGLAEQYAAEAFEAYRKHDHARAVTLYQRALTAAPSADILYNIARVYDLGLHNRLQAIEHYERYTLQPDAVPSRLEAARQRLFELHAAERAARIDPGPNAIARDFPLDVAQAPAPTPSPTHDREDLSPLDVAAISIGTAGLVGVGVGIGFGLSARSQSAWQRDCDGNACSSQSGVDAAEAASRRASIATLGFAAGGGLLALATVLWLVDGTGDDGTDTASSLELVPRASASELGAAVGGHF